MEQTTQNVDHALSKLSAAELDEFFEVTKNHLSLFEKIMPPSPYLNLLRRGEHEMAYNLLKSVQSK